MEKTIMENCIIILLAALLPAAMLMWCSYRGSAGCENRRELLWKGIVCGLAMMGAVEVLLWVFEGGLKALGYYYEIEDTLEKILIGSFFRAAIPEEMAKMVMLIAMSIWIGGVKSQRMGIVCATYITMVFAAIENVLCLRTITEDFAIVVLIRAMISTPGHYFYAVFMGLFFAKALSSERKWKRVGYAMIALLLPVLLHGTFDTLVLTKNLGKPYFAIGLPTFFLFYFLLAKYSIRIVRKQFKNKVMRSETYLTKDIERMRERIAKEVPEAGEFKTIEEVIVCPDTVTNISRLWLEVSGAPRGVEDYQHRRALKIVAERIDSDNAVLEIMFAQGTKEHILSELGKEEIILKLTRLTQKLAYC